MADIIQNLETHRFRINPDSLSTMKDLRTYFFEIKKECPQIRGLGFFGSRTKGTEKPTSDLDMVFFYDGSEFGTLSQLDPELEVLIKFTAITKNEDAIESLNSLRSRVVMEKKVKKIISERVNVDINLMAVDISPAFTDKLLDEFINSERYPEKASLTEYQDSQISLIARFFASVGEDVYKNRQYVLDKLKIQPKGEALFRVLMGRLAAFERTRDVLKGNPRKNSTEFRGYPQTIQEAEKYFRTQQHGYAEVPPQKKPSIVNQRFPTSKNPERIIVIDSHGQVHRGGEN